MTTVNISSDPNGNNVSTGADDDTVNIEDGITVSNTDIEVGSGNDTVSAGDNVTLDGSRVLLGDGLDTFEAGNGFTLRNSDIGEGVGDDLIIIGDDAFIDGGRVLGGSGSDTVRVGENFDNRFGDIDLGLDDDHLYLAFDNIERMSGRIMGGDGNDTVYFKTGTFVTDGTNTVEIGVDDPSILESGVTWTVTSNSGDAYEVQEFENAGVVCFASGSLIETKHGPVAVEALQPGDLVRTMDHGYQPIRWIGHKHLTSEMLAANPKLRPIRIRTGALGESMPERDLIVSPQHRVLLRSAAAQRMFGADEVLAGATQLLELEGVEIAEDMTEVTYVHFLCEGHEIVFSEGAMTESLYPGPEALKSLGSAALEEVYALFPELRDHAGTPMEPARRLLKGREARNMVARHVKNGKAMLTSAVPAA